MGAIPIVDFSAWSAGSPEEKQKIAKELTDAARGVGFVYIVNHGVPDDVLEQAFAWSKKLFDLPHEKKMLAPHPPGIHARPSVLEASELIAGFFTGPNVHRGYSWPGLEKVSQYIHKDGEDSDAEDQELRKVEDCKVNRAHDLNSHESSHQRRKAMRSAVKTARTCRTSGCQTRFFRGSGAS